MFGTTLIYKAKSTDMGTNEVRRNGEDQKETIRPEFNRSIMMDFQGAKIVSDVGFLFLREIDVRFGILGPIANHLEDSRSPLRTKHSLFQMALQRVYGIAAETRTATMLIFSGSILLRVAIRKDNEAGASQPMLSKLENQILGNGAGLTVLEAALNGSNEPLICPNVGIRIAGPFSETQRRGFGGRDPSESWLMGQNNKYS
jgi:hypothetical protein